MEVEVTTPDKYELVGNYPNPFNPTTKIRYSIPEATSVKLTVYNSLGQEIIKLVNEEKEAGTYDVVFNSASVNREIPSGVYFYRIETPTYSKTMKMMLMK